MFIDAKSLTKSLTYSTCYHLDFFAQLPSPVVTESREPKKIGNLWVYSRVMTF